MNTTTEKRPGWWKRNWKWALPVTLLASTVLLCGGFVTLIVGGVFGAMKSSEPYQHAVRMALDNPQVTAELGEPIKAGAFASGNINVNGPTGEANLAIPLTGSRKSGTVYVEARKRAGTWNYQLLQVGIDGQPQRIDLRAPAPETE